MDGQIFHAVLEYTKDHKEARIEVLEPFTFMLELIDAKAILDIKIASFGYDQNIVLAVTETSLYQFCGDTMIKGVLEVYGKSK